MVFHNLESVFNIFLLSLGICNISVRLQILSKYANPRYNKVPPFNLNQSQYLREKKKLTLVAETAQQRKIKDNGDKREPNKFYHQGN